jgi:hypothetical protein
MRGQAILGWTQGNLIGGFKLSEPVNWPLQLRIIEAVPGAGSGACFTPDVEPGVYGRRDYSGEVVEEEITPEEARESDARARACIADARRENRDYTKQWANWMSILLLAAAGIGIYDHQWRRRRHGSIDARTVPTSVPTSPPEKRD